ncbi:hypothetical protein PHYSODRAFT_509745 [Phytophthora sojae]|uniref:BZIP domain-containing protein n=1 Tax=Phytophthora sojae (strain P6497) TaxID=1094619 RepID=G4ZPT4_PHYSP|nr:hypothetical protein PHYSODRAFT_509745 [Phytophthora sojae]EGZ16339.1 hypothetical protein PHYSODRAFT_509745 [Phytophthora sojae]|eukprot:XP_009530088.1 hypothetical protein PHYSODRAFT_509745 [Phytophthora sojae]
MTAHKEPNPAYDEASTTRNKRVRQPSPLSRSRRFKSGATQSRAVDEPTRDERLADADWAKLVIEERDNQRRLRRERHRRYRQKQTELMEHLERHNPGFQLEVSKLEERLRTLLAAVRPKETLWTVASEYFRVFRYGAVYSATREVQLEFVRSGMSPDVLSNSGYGAEALVASWAHFSGGFEDVEVELQGLKKDTDNSVVGTATTSFTITERTIDALFPCLNEERSQVADRILNQRVSMDTSVRFVWDAVVSRVTSVVSRSDLLTPMLGLVGDVASVARMFKDSRVYV